MKLTHENSIAYEHSMDHAVEFFSKAGSLFSKRGSFYGRASEENALGLFQKVWIVDKEIAFKLFLWLRDCRGGAGNRSGAREILHWLGDNASEWVNHNIEWIPEVGRWDDLRVLWNTESQSVAAALWAYAIKNKNVLAAKWADRNDYPLRKLFEMKIGDFRRTLAKIRKGHIVEFKMCTNQWNQIIYKTVPSVAMARYTNAFNRHDAERFEIFKNKIKTGEEKVHADVLFPHDCVRTVYHGDNEIADAQFLALPNYMEGTNEKIIVIADTSASMNCVISGSIRAVDISQGMALYCSEKIGSGPFYKKFIQFCSESKFTDWEQLSFSEAVRCVFDRAMGSTRIDKALELILKTAKFFGLTQEQMPTTLLIVSDMQFSQGVASENNTEVEVMLKRFKNAGYIPPKIVYWNTAGYLGEPAIASMKNVGMISGFSPGVLKAVFSGKDFSPKGIMLRALEKYKIVVPE